MEAGSVSAYQGASTPTQLNTRQTSETRQFHSENVAMDSSREYQLEGVSDSRQDEIERRDADSAKIIDITKNEGFDKAFESIANGSAFSQDEEHTEEVVGDIDRFTPEMREDPETAALKEKIAFQDSEIRELTNNNQKLIERVTKLEDFQKKMIEALLLMRKVELEEDEEKKKGMLERLFDLVGFLIGMIADPEEEGEKIEEKVAA